DELDDPDAVSVVRGEGLERIDILIVRSGESIRAYEKVCPHKGTPLETFDGRFFTRDQSRLLCSTHGAEFRLVDGYCVAGPCKGRRLQEIPILVDQTGFVNLK
ncbi:MAG: Rieske (2Fe-2S) protein, partial [Fimbriimonadaceae bacterium]|nr:Rieske (2Fe-2S) protein [Alphaproteobacteria bacterium]